VRGRGLGELLAGLGRERLDYRHTGPRNQIAARAFASNGHLIVYNLMDGIDAWWTEIDPHVRSY